MKTNEERERKIKILKLRIEIMGPKYQKQLERQLKKLLDR